jgi:hypothetical protein
MTEYGKFTLRPINPLPLLTSDEERIRLEVKEAKEAHRKIIEAVMQRRREIYRRWYKKMQLQPSGDLV